MTDTIRSHRLAVPCPKCGHENSKSLGVLERYEKAGRTFACGGCGRKIEVPQVARTIKQLEESVAKEFAKFGKRIAKLRK